MKQDGPSVVKCWSWVIDMRGCVILLSLFLWVYQLVIITVLHNNQPHNFPVAYSNKYMLLTLPGSVVDCLGGTADLGWLIHTSGVG